MGIRDRLAETLELVATLRKARLIAPMRPDRYLRIAAVMRREGLSVTSGFASAAERCPDRPGLIDQLGTLTWKQLDERCDAFAAALQLPAAADRAAPKTIGSRAATTAALSRRWSRRTGSAPSGSSPGPTMPAGRSEATRGWNRASHDRTVEKMIGEHTGQKPTRTDRKGKLIAGRLSAVGATTR
jgi:hypothetical protein